MGVNRNAYPTNFVGQGVDLADRSSIINPMMNEQRLQAIKADLASAGITHFDCYQGNDCIMVTYGRVVSYYHFRGNTIVSVTFD